MDHILLIIYLLQGRHVMSIRPPYVGSQKESRLRENGYKNSPHLNTSPKSEKHHLHRDLKFDEVFTSRSSMRRKEDTGGVEGYYGMSLFHCGIFAAVISFLTTILGFSSLPLPFPFSHFICSHSHHRYRARHEICRHKAHPRGGASRCQRAGREGGSTRLFTVLPDGWRI